MAPLPLPSQGRPEVWKSLLISFSSLLTGHIQPRPTVSAFLVASKSLFHFAPLRWPPTPVPAIPIFCLRRHTGHPAGVPSWPYNPFSMQQQPFFWFLVLFLFVCFLRNKPDQEMLLKNLDLFLSQVQNSYTVDKALQQEFSKEIWGTPRGPERLYRGLHNQKCLNNFSSFTLTFSRVDSGVFFFKLQTCEAKPYTDLHKYKMGSLSFLIFFLWKIVDFHKTRAT